MVEAEFLRLCTSKGLLAFRKNDIHLSHNQDANLGLGSILSPFRTPQPAPTCNCRL